jgi:cytochrome c biogenesis protein
MTSASLAPETTPPHGGFSVTRVYDLLFRWFCSLKLTVFNITTLMLGCFVGMFIDQTKSFEEHARVWMESPWQWKYRVFTALEFHDVFHSWWFSIIVLVLALNLIACSIERLPKIWLDIKYPDPKLTPRKERGIKHRVVFGVTDAAAFEDAVVRLLGRVSAPQKSDEGDVRFTFTERHKWARTGVYVVHTALLLIMFGSMATTTLGFDGTVGVVEGSENRYAYGKGPAGLRFRKDLGFTIRCTDFRLKQFIDGAPMDFESDLVIVQDGREVVRKTIQVNDPLEYNGYTLYQASYQPVPGDERVELEVGRRGQPGQKFSVTPGTAVQATGAATTYVPLEVIPKYAALGPALRIQEVKEGQPPKAFVVFKDYPDFDAQVRRGEFSVRYLGAEKTYMTGIQVGKVPGVEVVFWGFAVMFVGMYMAFFMSHRRYWLRLERAGDGWTATVAGAARRHQYAFEEEFEALREKIQALPGVTRG